MKIAQGEGIFINGATNGSTDLNVVDSTGAVYGNGIYARSGSTAVQVASSTGGLYHQGTALTATPEEINNSTYDRSVQQLTSGSSATQITGYGITVNYGDTGCSLHIAAPKYAGVSKKLIYTQGSSIARSVSSTAVGTTAGDGTGWYFYSTASSNSSSITFTTGTTHAFSVELIGLTTNTWMVMVPYTSDALEYTVETT